MSVHIRQPVREQPYTGYWKSLVSHFATAPATHCGQKPTDCGHLCRGGSFALCYSQNEARIWKEKQSGFVEKKKLANRRIFRMRHVWIRMILALVWLAAAIVSGGALYVVLGLVFLVSGYSVWKREKKGKGED